MNKKTILSILPVALALGTAWAVRGRFGHEQGAAWAGAIGTLALILVANRPDWYRKAFRIVMAGAFGWGISGVMSYGMIVGYGRGTDFPNVFYGLLMLFVLGVLYGFLGGGFVGLALADSRESKVRWHAVLVQMVALGLLVYAVLINQLGWYMTPPRSEMWAACLGAAIALGWYMVRHEHQHVLRVAVWSALGAGFGFAFGNFLQVLGSASGIRFNWWNVMEYSIGFFGGIGMAFGTLTASWRQTTEKLHTQSNWLPLLFVALFIPFVVWQQSFVADRFDFVTGDNSARVTLLLRFIAIAAILLVAARVLYRNYGGHAKTNGITRAIVWEFFILFTALYILLSFLITGVFVHPVEQYLYVINLVAIALLITRQSPAAFEARENSSIRWVGVSLVCVAIIALLAMIAVKSHDGMPGSQVRFVINK